MIPVEKTTINRLETSNMVNSSSNDNLISMSNDNTQRFLARSKSPNQRSMNQPLPYKSKIAQSNYKIQQIAELKMKNRNSPYLSHIKLKKMSRNITTPKTVSSLEIEVEKAVNSGKKNNLNKDGFSDIKEEQHLSPDRTRKDISM